MCENIKFHFKLQFQIGFYYYVRNELATLKGSKFETYVQGSETTLDDVFGWR